MDHNTTRGTERFFPDSETGLSAQQVRDRTDSGCTNQYISNTTKSYGQILKEHFFTFYNILNITLAALLLSVGAYKDLTFMVIVISNFIIGLVQEIYSKRTLDKLALIVAARVRVVRGGKTETIPVAGLVRDDVMEKIEENGFLRAYPEVQVEVKPANNPNEFIVYFTFPRTRIIMFLRQVDDSSTIVLGLQSYNNDKLGMREFSALEDRVSTILDGLYLIVSEVVHFYDPGCTVKMEHIR